MSRQLILSHSIYPPHCVEKAVDTYRAICDIRVADANSERSSLLLESVDVDEERLAREFLNYVLDVSLEWHLQGL
jgi:hypothetical protein